MKNLKFLLLLLLCFNCAGRKFENIPYQTNTPRSKVGPTLNIFSPKKSVNNTYPVLIFVHGGSWNSGKKETYNLMGRNFSRKDIVTVIPDYTLSPNANYDQMAEEITQAIRWVQKNITDFGGNQNNIFLTGHSAGGHLVALVATNPKYLKDEEMVDGVILNDAAALDMFNYLTENPPTERLDYITTWTVNPENWKDASPIYFLGEDTPPFKIYMGTKTYPSIINGNREFLQELKKYQPQAEIILLNKKHIPMIAQFLWPYSNRYDEFAEFMNSQKK